MTEHGMSIGDARNPRLVCASILMVLVGIAGCADDPCADALQKLEDCGVSGGREAESDEECVDARACTAECINEVDCDDIIAPRPDSMYTSCVNACEFGPSSQQ